MSKWETISTKSAHRAEKNKAIQLNLFTQLGSEDCARSVDSSEDQCRSPGSTDSDKAVLMEDGEDLFLPRGGTEEVVLDLGTAKPDNFQVAVVTPQLAKTDNPPLVNYQ